MSAKNLILISIIFVVFGFGLLFIGTILLTFSVKHEFIHSPEGKFLLISGRVICTAGGLLVLGTFITCMYVGYVGSPSGQITEASDTVASSQMSKANVVQAKSSMTPAVGSISHGWQVNEKFVRSGTAPLAASRNLYLPSGDANDSIQSHPNAKKNSVKLGNLSNWSNSAIRNGQFLDQRRNCNADVIGTMLAHVPSLPTIPTRKRISLSTLSLGRTHLHGSSVWTGEHQSTMNNSGTFPSQDMTNVELLGSNLNTDIPSLYRGGQIKLGNHH